MKTASKKSASKKTSVKKVASKKGALKKSAIKKPASKKSVAKKTITKKTSTKKSASKEKSISNNIKKYRLELGMTLDQLAAKCGVTRAGIWQMENGWGMRVSTLIKISKIFKTSLEDLIQR